MLNRFQETLRSLIVGRICLPCIFGLILVLVLPCALDQHNHDVGSIEGSQTLSDFLRGGLPQVDDTVYSGWGAYPVYWPTRPPLQAQPGRPVTLPAGGRR